MRSTLFVSRDPVPLRSRCSVEHTIRAVGLAIFVSLSSLAVAQADLEGGSDDLFIVPRLTGEVLLDGRVEEAAWDAVAPLPLVRHWTDFGAPPSEATEIRLAYDDAYLYLSCRCYGPPEVLRAVSFERDQHSRASDYLGIALDTYNDNESAVYMLLSPTGSRTDMAIANDADNTDTSWNTFWDAEAMVTPEGWFAEMRIPFSSLRFQNRGDRVVMGLSAWRHLAGKSELNLFPAIPPEWGFWSFIKPSQLQKVTFEGIGARRPVYITPYALGGLGQEFDLNEAETAYVRTDDSVTELGGDLKVALSDNLALDLTLNTDFAQVEADNQQVNLTRFSLFFPEKRQFFLERASIFDFSLGSSNRLFYSRRIGLSDGEAVRILGGGRAVGRAGGWDFGVLDLQTARRRVGPDEVLPSENFGVVRLRRQAFNAYSTVGGIVTSRLGDDGSYNVAYGLDGDVRIFGDTFAEAKWAQTFDDELGGDVLDQARIRLAVERRAYTGFGYAVKAERAGRTYRPGLGFEVREDFSAAATRLWHGWGSGTRFARHRVQAYGITYLRNADDTAETVEAGASWGGSFNSGGSVDLSIDVTYDDLREGFDLADEAEVLPGDYTFVAASAGYGLPDGGAWGAYVSAGGGSFYDGWRATTSVSPRWIVSKHLEIGGDYELNRIDFPDRDQTFTAHVGRLRVRAALNTEWSFSSFLQLNSAADAGIANVRLRYNPREGSDFYLVFNEGFNTDRLRASPARPFTSRRALLAKYTYTFIL